MRRAFTPGILLFILLSPAAQIARAQGAAGYVSPDGTAIEELLAGMKSRNLELQAAQQRLAQAEGRLRQSGLWLNPVVEVDNKGAFNSADGPSETEFAVVQPVEIGGKRAARVSVAKAARELARLEIAELERRTAVDLRLRAGEALATAARLRALDEAVDLQQKMQKAVVLRVSAGDASRFDLALSDAETARLNADREPLLSQLEGLIAEIKTLAGIEQTASLVLREQDLVAPSIKEAAVQEAALVDKALASRPDLLAARWRVTMAQSGLRLAEAGAYPDLGFLVGFKAERGSAAEAPGLKPGSDWLFRFGVSVGLPLFNRNQGTRQQTAALLAEARLAADQAEQAVRRDVHLAVRRLELAHNSLRLIYTRLVPQTESATRIARTGYDLGELSLQQLIMEQRRLVEARGTLAQAGLQAYRARVELARAVGQ